MRIRLCTFDAFDTIFRPVRPVHIQYAEVARSFGVNVNANELLHEFRKAFKEQSQRAPNYGRYVGIDYRIWWTSIIQKTFTALTPNIPPELAPALLKRFHSGEGYELFPDVVPALEVLAGNAKLGIVSNSDPRVPDILESLGVKHFFDCIVLSYDSFEKPDGRIFQKACTMSEVQSNESLHVGDDLQKDYYGALHAGWKAVQMDRQRKCSDPAITTISSLSDVSGLLRDIK